MTDLPSTFTLNDLLLILAVAVPYIGYIIRIERKISTLTADIAWIKTLLQEHNPQA